MLKPCKPSLLDRIKLTEVYWYKDKGNESEELIINSIANIHANVDITPQSTN